MKVALVLIVVIAVVGGAYFLISTGKIPNPLSKKTATVDLGTKIFEKTQNPIQDKIPEINPFSRVNPFKGVYKNPFQ